MAPSIWTTGARVQQPRQATRSTVNKPCGSVSLSSRMPRVWRNAPTMFSAPLTKQAVPTHTRIVCRPAGVRRKPA